MKRRQRRRGGLTHCIATCTECEREWQKYTTARQLAVAHARRTGHKVLVEVAYAYTYGGGAR